MEVLQIQLIAVDEIKVKDRSRVDMGNIHELQESIRKKGLLQPITVDAHKFLLAGERRLIAHKNLGWKHINCIVRKDDEKLTKLEIELDENARRKDLAWPERARLEKKIWELQKEKDPKWSQRQQQRVYHPETGTASNMMVSMRLELADALETMPELANHSTQEEAYKELKRYEEVETKIAMVLKKSKDIEEAPKWAEEHYVIGDAFNGMANFLKTQPHSKGQAFQFAEVDPPYGVDLHRRKGRNANSQSMEEYLEWEDFPKLFETSAKLTYECLDPHAFAIFWYGMSRHQEVLDILRRVGWNVPDIPAIWYKGEVGQTASPDTTFGSCYEPFFVARKGQPKLARPGRGNVFNFPSLQKKTHPTEKPVWLLEEVLGVFCWPGSRVLCPFLGSGVTLRAAYKLGHTGMGWDLSERHKAGFLATVAADMVAADAANAERVAHANP